MAENYNLIFNVSCKDYVDFSMLTVLLNLRKKNVIQKNRLYGTIELLIGVGLVVFFGVLPTKMDLLLCVLGVALILCGINAFIYYPKVYPSMVKKAVEKSYDKSGYKDSTINIELTSEKIIETVGEEQNIYDFSETNGVYFTTNYFLLRINQEKGILIPTKVIENKLEFMKFLENICDKNNLEKLYGDEEFHKK